MQSVAHFQLPETVSFLGRLVHYQLPGEGFSAIEEMIWWQRPFGLFLGLRREVKRHAALECESDLRTL